MQKCRICDWIIHHHRHIASVAYEWCLSKRFMALQPIYGTVLVENEIDKLFLYSTRRLYTTDDADIGVAS